MKKRLLSIFIAVLMLLSLLPTTALAASTVASGTCGKNLTWTLDSNGLLTISGTGDMTDYDAAFPPWGSYLESIKKIQISSGVTSIGSNAFGNCDSLTSVTIPYGVTRIGKYAFSVCYLLSSVTIPNSVTHIDEGAFYFCTTLSSISIPDSVTNIGKQAFEFCSSLSFVSIPPKVTSIGDYTFHDCDNLTGVTIPEGIISIGKGAFSACPSLTSVTFPSSLTSIGKEAFYYCPSLGQIKFTGNAPSIYSSAFRSVKCTAYYPANNATWTSSVRQNYGGQITWVPYTSEEGSTTFTDVYPVDWFASAVEYAVENGLMNGVGNGRFEPNASMTRAMLVTVLWRYADEPAGYTNKFSDVPAGKWYTNAVAWATAKGIVTGVGNNKFDPDGNITREQMATIMYRYCQKTGIDTSARANLSIFPDGNKVSSWAKDALSWANAVGLITGSTENGKTYLLPQGNTTRAQVATILMRFIENVVNK